MELLEKPRIALKRAAYAVQEDNNIDEAKMKNERKVPRRKYGWVCSAFGFLKGSLIELQKNSTDNELLIRAQLDHISNANRIRLVKKYTRLGNVALHKGDDARSYVLH